ncbi:BatA and WFA domain-containing protein [Lysinibacillus sp. KU-BSD001]|uniref:vWA domain-containing protein n=1 Tax=Lysinibacillus sp. KU-BSD001 TaxID=3141328 RepID=UPI0036F17BDC
MGFMNVAFIGMIIFPIIVLLYYFFRKKYTKQTVSSTLFWEELMQETKASPYLKKLQKNSLLFLQLAALLLLVFALMKPYLPSTKIAGEQVIFVVDTSATMLAGKEATTFEQHKDKMKQLLKDMDGKSITLVTTGRQPTVVLREETNTAEVEKAVDTLEVTYEQEHMEKAVEVVQAFIGQRTTAIYVFTDSLEKQQLPVESAFVEWHVYGQTEELNNVAITKFAATAQGEQTTALVQLTNETDQTQNITIDLYGKDQRLVSEQLTLEQHDTIIHLFNQLPLTPTITAKIEVNDEYALDNEWVTTIQQETIEVMLDPSTHTLVQKGFAAVYDHVTFFDDATLKQANEQSLLISNDVALLDGQSPVILIGRNDESSKEMNAFASPSSAALFSFSPLQDVYVQSIYPPFEQFDTIATVNEEPFIQLSPKGDIIVLADLQATDWPLHPSFPLFLWSAVQQISAAGDSMGTFTPKQSASIALRETEWSIYDEEGKYVSSFTSGKQFIAPDKPGLYELSSEDESRLFSTVLAASERHIQFGKSFTLGQLTNENEEVETSTSFFPYIVLIILLLILAEWEVQRRRGFTN